MIEDQPTEGEQAEIWKAMKVDEESGQYYVDQDEIAFSNAKAKAKAEEQAEKIMAKAMPKAMAKAMARAISQPKEEAKRLSSSLRHNTSIRSWSRGSRP